MPFCRKCGRRLPEYSENCPDCKMSTTAPMINIKKITSRQATKEVSPTKLATVVPPVPEVTVPAKAVATAVATFKVATPPKNTATKPVLSAKHIVKPKKATPPKQTAPFTIVFNRPAATPKVLQPKPVVRPKIVEPPVFVPVKPAITAALVAPAQPVLQTVIAPPPIPPAPVIPPHEIKQSNVSLKEDLLANPDDYEKEAFDFDLKCVNGHFWRAGRALPVSNGKAYCLKCGERLGKPKRFKQNRYHRY